MSLFMVGGEGSKGKGPKSRFLLFIFSDVVPKIDKIAVWIAPKSETMIIFKIFGCRMRRDNSVSDQKYVLIQI